MLIYIYRIIFLRNYLLCFVDSINVNMNVWLQDFWLNIIYGGLPLIQLDPTSFKQIRDSLQIGQFSLVQMVEGYT